MARNGATAVVGKARDGKGNGGINGAQEEYLSPKRPTPTIINNGAQEEYLSPQFSIGKHFRPQSQTQFRPPQ